MNGVRTGLTGNIILKAPPMIHQALKMDWPKPCGAATGEVRTGIAGVRLAASVHRTAAAIDSVFV